MKIIINGINGSMGQNVLALATATEGCEVVAGIDRYPEAKDNPCPTYANLFECAVEADMLIDFSSPEAVSSILTYCEKHSVKPIICTTGLGEQEHKLLETYKRSVPIFHSANMSLGVNLQSTLARTATGFLGDGFEVEIMEKHHHRKKDSPSGTALMLAKVINEAAGGDRPFVYGRHSKTEKRTPTEIGIHAIRGGTIVGEHDVMFIGTDEIIEVNHAAHSRQVFAAGALRAAQFMMKQGPGLYDMNDIVAETMTVTKLTTAQGQAIITLRSFPAGAQSAYGLFDRLAKAGINIDMISHSVPRGDQVDMSFTLHQDALATAIDVLNTQFPEGSGVRVDISDSITKLTVSGPGMRRQAGVAAKLFEVLAREEIDVLAVSTSETKIDACIDSQSAQLAAVAVKKAFEI